MTHAKKVLASFVCVLAFSPIPSVLADPITFNPAIVFIDNDGANSVGLTPGQNITVILGPDNKEAPIKAKPAAKKSASRKRKKKKAE